MPSPPCTTDLFALQPATADAIDKETGNRPRFTAGDITSAPEIGRAVDRTVAECGGLWALFNNTGGPPAGPFDQFADEDWQKAFELTMLGYVRAIRAALPHLRRSGQGGGRIVNNTSASTKQAIDGLTVIPVERIEEAFARLRELD